MITNLIESTIPTDFTLKMRSKVYKWTESNTPFIFGSIFSAVGHYLSANKSKDETVGVKFLDTKGEFLMGASVKYTKNEENEEMPGNWDIDFTFYQENFKVDNEVLSSDARFVGFLVDRAERLYGMFFKADIYTYEMVIFAMQVLRQALQVNSKDEEEFAIKMPSYFTAVATVENGETVMSLEIDELLKQVIKDDSSEV